MSRVKFQLLELNVISAQDLYPVTKKLQTYATVYINPERKLRTRTDQIGRNNPTWNEKFVFRVNDELLNSNGSKVVIELHASGWLKDIPVGLVQVSLTDLIPHFVRTSRGSSNRIVALQIRRPSGRPQGILNMGVTLLDNTIRSMPLDTELGASADRSHEFNDSNTQGKGPKLGQQNEAGKIRLKRSKSDIGDLAPKEKPGILKNPTTLPNNGPYGSSMIGSINADETGGQGWNGSVCGYSDLGPSASVVALAVARGLILTPIGVAQNSGGSILADWKTEESNIEGIKSKMARWRTEHEPLTAAPNVNYHRVENNSSKTSKGRKLRRSKTDAGGLFRCIGNAYGFEISIVCGGGQNQSRKNRSLIPNRSCDSDESSMLTTSW
ncbi:hypothetical protein Leryth_018040 [Lithospermum erythrorhizon]|uniref:C2 domain-containing protein n=1 Tax=Lithospermum erythrorhizon TaxID=34254 RepID=A0AAV3QDG9_LITER|nr:hypothetical protein Leryth_018040 [Lithospermum erythrorhizon]